MSDRKRKSVEKKMEEYKGIKKNQATKNTPTKRGGPIE